MHVLRYFVAPCVPTCRGRTCWTVNSQQVYVHVCFTAVAVASTSVPRPSAAQRRLDVCSQ